MSFTEKDFDPINQRNLKALDNGGTTHYIQKQRAVLIGDGHKAQLVEETKGASAGQIKITKGTLVDPGKLEVTGCRDRNEFENAIKRISKKKVVFK